MSTIEDIYELARADVVDGLGGSFADGDFRRLKDFEGLDLPSGNVAFVPWEYHTRHTGTFFGLDATQRDVVLVGVTAIDTTGVEPLFHRFVDWANVLAQLGVTWSARPLT